MKTKHATLSTHYLGFKVSKTSQGFHLLCLEYGQ
jgi:hypothetical protein